MKLAVISCVVFTVISVLTGTADAAVTAWTNPSITGASGSGTATPSIAEDKAVGDTGVTIAATAGGTKTYAIKSQPTAGKITISGTSGVLSLANSFSFDFETEPTYVLVITCADAGDSTTGTATVTLNITNVGPIMAQSQYSVTIPDGSTAGTSLISVSAKGQNAGDTVTYSITGGNSPTHWKIDTNTGKITVNDAVTLNQATLGGYSLTVTATVSSTTDTARVWVALTTCSGVAAIISSGFMMFIVLATKLL